MELVINEVNIKQYKYLKGTVLPLYQKTVLQGKNGSGKTSVLRTVFWVFYNKTLRNTRMTGVPASQETEVKFTLDGVAMIATRRGKGGVKVIDGGGAASVVEDMEGLFGLTAEKFLSVFIHEFVPNMGPAAARALLMSIVPALDVEAVAKTLDADTEKSILALPPADLAMDAIDNTMTKIKKEIEDKEKNLERLNGQREAFEETSGKKKPAIPPAPDRSQVDKLQAELANYRASQKDKPAAEAALNRKKADLARVKESLESGKKRTEEQISRLGGMRKREEDVKTTCLSCGQSLPEEAKKKALEAVRTHNQQLLEQIEATKRQQTETEQKLTAQIAQIETEVDDLSWEFDLLDSTAIAASIAEAEKKLTEAQTAYDEAVKERTLLIQEGENIDKARTRVGELADEMDKISKVVAESKKKMETIRTYKVAYLDQQTVFFETNGLKRAKIQLWKEKSDGTTGQDFTVTWKNDRGETVEYDDLSEGEKTHCGVEIATMLANVLHVSVPVFIDDADHVLEWPSDDLRQWIYARPVAVPLESREVVPATKVMTK